MTKKKEEVKEEVINHYEINRTELPCVSIKRSKTLNDSIIETLDLEVKGDDLEEALKGIKYLIELNKKCLN